MLPGIDHLFGLSCTKFHRIRTSIIILTQQLIPEFFPLKHCFETFLQQMFGINYSLVVQCIGKLIARDCQNLGLEVNFVDFQTNFFWKSLHDSFHQGRIRKIAVLVRWLAILMMSTLPTLQISWDQLAKKLLITHCMYSIFVQRATSLRISFEISLGKSENVYYSKLFWASLIEWETWKTNFPIFWEVFGFFSKLKFLVSRLTDCISSILIISAFY